MIVTMAAAAWCLLSSSRPAQADTDAVDGTRPAEQAAVADTLRELYWRRNSGTRIESRQYTCTGPNPASSTSSGWVEKTQTRHGRLSGRVWPA